MIKKQLVNSRKTRKLQIFSVKVDKNEGLSVCSSKEKKKTKYNKIKIDSLFCNLQANPKFWPD